MFLLFFNVFYFLFNLFWKKICKKKRKINKKHQNKRIVRKKSRKNIKSLHYEFHLKELVVQIKNIIHLNIKIPKIWALKFESMT